MYVMILWLCPLNHNGRLFALGNCFLKGNLRACKKLCFYGISRLKLKTCYVSEEGLFYFDVDAWLGSFKKNEF